jgi:hypothetical protein
MERPMRPLHELEADICSLAGRINVVPGFTQPPGDWRQLPEGTLVNKWRGEKMDYSTAIEAMIYKEARAKDVPAGTSIDG